jgi:hypothetical protein
MKTVVSPWISWHVCAVARFVYTPSSINTSAGAELGMLGSCAFIAGKVLKSNDCLGRQVLFAAVAGTTVPKP